MSLESSSGGKVNSPEGQFQFHQRQDNWGSGKRELLQELLAELVRVDAGLPNVVTAYAEIFAADQAGGHNTGQNDMWIAATTKAAGAVLLTCDNDCVWMSPALVAVEYVPTVKST